MADIDILNPQTPPAPSKYRLGSAVITVEVPVLSATGRLIGSEQMEFSMSDPIHPPAVRSAAETFIIQMARYLRKVA